MPNDPEERDLSADGQTNGIDDSWKWEWHGKEVIIPNESEDRSSAAEETVPLRPPAQTTHDDQRDATSFALTPPKDGEAFFIGTDGERHPMLPARDPIIPTMQGTSVPPMRVLRTPELTFESVDPGLASSRWNVPNKEWRGKFEGPLNAADLAPFLQGWMSPPVLDKGGEIVPGEYHASARINIERLDLDRGVVIANNAPSQGSRVTFNYTYAPQPLTIWKRFLNRCSYLLGRLRYRVLH